MTLSSVQSRSPTTEEEADSKLTGQNVDSKPDSTVGSGGKKSGSARVSTGAATPFGKVSQAGKTCSREPGIPVTSLPDRTIVWVKNE